MICIYFKRFEFFGIFSPFCRKTWSNEKWTWCSAKSNFYWRKRRLIIEVPSPKKRKRINTANWAPSSAAHGLSSILCQSNHVTEVCRFVSSLLTTLKNQNQLDCWVPIFFRFNKRFCQASQNSLCPISREPFADTASSTPSEEATQPEPEERHEQPVRQNPLRIRPAFLQRFLPDRKVPPHTLVYFLLFSMVLFNSGAAYFKEKTGFSSF